MCSYEISPSFYTVMALPISTFNPQSSAPLQCFLQSLVLTLCSAELWSIPRFIGEAGKFPVSFWGLISLKAQQTWIQRLIEGDRQINESPWLSPSPHPSHRLQNTSRCRCLHSTLGNHCPTNHMGPQPGGAPCATTCWCLRLSGGQWSGWFLPGIKWLLHAGKI